MEGGREPEERGYCKGAHIEGLICNPCACLSRWDLNLRVALFQPLVWTNDIFFITILLIEKGT